MKLKTIEMPEKAVSRITAALPEYVIQQREAGRNQTLSYISGATVIDILNTAFGHAGWDFQIIKSWIQDSYKYFDTYAKVPEDKKVLNNAGKKGVWTEQAPIAWVQGKLIVHLRDEETGEIKVVTKEAFGSKSIIGKQSEQEHIFKSAQTDALKKAASLLGIGAELYRGEEEAAYYSVISKPVVWDTKLCAESKAWQSLEKIREANCWTVKDINYYVSALTEGEYDDIYTLPEAYIDSLIESISSLDEEE